MVKVLLITDDISSLAPLREAVSPQGYELDTALSAEEALEKTVSVCPDVIVIHHLKIGKDVFAQVQQHIPVVAASPREIEQPEVFIRLVRTALARRRVLVADDDRQMAQILSAILEKAGYETKIAHDGMETLREIKTWQPHLVVLDVMLPVIDGFHVCQTMNEDHSYEPRPKVLIVSGRSSDWDQTLGAACGAEYYLVKPFSNNYFIEKVTEIMAQ